MADVELVVKISEDLYKATVNGLDANEIWDLRFAVKNGTPLPKGHWLSQREHCRRYNLIPSGLGSYFWCSECNHAVDVREWHRNHYNYCPTCGARMVEPQESEG